MIQNVLFFIALLMLYSPCYAMEDHSKHMEKNYANGQDVTLRCLECHADQGDAFMKTAHWLWKGETPFLEGREKGVELGKINLLNDY